MTALVLLLDDTIHPATAHELRRFCLLIRGVRGAIEVAGGTVDVDAERAQWEAAMAKIGSRLEGELANARLAGAV